MESSKANIDKQNLLKSKIPHLDSHAFDIEVLHIHAEKELPPPPHTNSSWATVFLLLNTMIGSGILNQPEVFKEAGILGATVMFLISAVFIWTGIVALIECGEEHKKLDYSELAKYAFPSWGELIIDAMIVLNNFGALLSYITVVGGTSATLLQNWGCEDDACGFYSMTIILIVFLVLPFCLLRYYGHLTYVSYLSIFAIVCVLLLVIFGGPFYAKEGRIVVFHGAGALTKIGSVVFSLSCAPASFHAYTSLDDPLKPQWRAVIAYAVVIGGFMCFTMGVAGYVNFRAHTDGEILDNFHAHYADTFKVLLVCHLILYIPVDFIVMRFSIVKLMGNKDGSFLLPGHVALTLSLLALTTIIVILLRYIGFSTGAAFGMILDFTGGVAGSITSFVLPALLYLKLMPRSAPLFWPAAAMLLFGIFVAITVPVASVLAFL